MIMIGKVIVTLVWIFWLFASGSIAEGKPSDQDAIS